MTASVADGHSVHVAATVAGPSWYRFRAGGFTSPIGRLAPVTGDAASLRLASASCQHFETGFYAAHRDIAEWAPDAVVFLGDFIYEGASNPVGDGRVRSHDGPEPVDLAGYRARYAQYLSDPDLQASRACAPWLVIWDDHEVENNYAGLEPQDPAERDAFPTRRAAAYRAWWEHMPVRLPPPVDGADDPIYRTVSLGGLADVIMLDGRQYRSDQACGDVTLSVDPPCPESLDPARTMLGATQEAWVGGELAAGRSTWTVLAQQTVLTDLRLPNGAVVNFDQWDGYGPARERLLAQAAVADRVVVLTGDIHLAGIGRLPGVGTELVASSISSERSRRPRVVADRHGDPRHRRRRAGPPRLHPPHAHRGRVDGRVPHGRRRDARRVAGVDVADVPRRRGHPRPARRDLTAGTRPGGIGTGVRPKVGSMEV